MRTFVLLISLGVVSACSANRSRVQSQRQLLGPFPGSFLALSVADIDRQVGWYRDTLGFEITTQGDALNGSVRYAILQQGFTMLEIIQHREARSRATAAPGTTDSHQIHGIFKAGFLLADIDFAYATLVQRGVRFEYRLGKPDQSPYRSFGVRDPEGNLLQFFGR